VRVQVPVAGGEIAMLLGKIAEHRVALVLVGRE
jgi:hypothetical protein